MVMSERSVNLTSILPGTLRPPSRELSVKTFPLIYQDASVRIWTHRDGRNHSLKFETDLYNTIYFCIKVLVSHIYLMLYNFGVYQPITSLPSVAL